MTDVSAGSAQLIDADEVHAHGFEVEKEISDGVPTTLVLKGSLAGVYEVEMHKPALTLLQVAVS